MVIQWYPVIYCPLPDYVSRQWIPTLLHRQVWLSKPWARWKTECLAALQHDTRILVHPVFSTWDMHRHAFFQAVWDVRKGCSCHRSSGRGGFWREVGSPQGRLLSARAWTSMVSGRGSSLTQGSQMIWYKMPPEFGCTHIVYILLFFFFGTSRLIRKALKGDVDDVWKR